MSERFWTPERLAEAHHVTADIKRKGGNARDAARELSSRWGHPVGAEGLKSQLQRNPQGKTEQPYIWVREQEEPGTIPEMPPAAAVEVEAEDTFETIRAEHEEHGELVGLRAAKKMLLRELESRDAQIEALLELRKMRPLPPIVAVDKPGHQRQGMPWMMLSDLHVEERVDPEKVNGLNKYNLQIAERCLDAAADSYIWLQKDSRYDCRAGGIWIGGDTFSGYIHAELQETNFLSPTKAVLWLQERLERLLRKIAAECPNLERIVVPCNDGNHGRLTQKMRASTRTDNSLEWLMYQTLALRLSDDPRFEFQIADGVFNYVQAFDTSLCFLHGDIYRYQGGVGGITIPLRKGFNEVVKRRIKIDHMLLGHFHQRLDLGKIVVNGSMIGTNPYSLQLNCEDEPRQQSWFMVDSNHGKSQTAPVWLPQYDPSRD